MAIKNFPTNPVNNQYYFAENDVLYKYTDGAWHIIKDRLKELSENNYSLFYSNIEENNGYINKNTFRSGIVTKYFNGNQYGFNGTTGGSNTVLSSFDVQENYLVAVDVSGALVIVGIYLNGQYVSVENDGVGPLSSYGAGEFSCVDVAGTTGKPFGLIRIPEKLTGYLKINYTTDPGLIGQCFDMYSLFGAYIKTSGTLSSTDIYVDSYNVNELDVVYELEFLEGGIVNEVFKKSDGAELKRVSLNLSTNSNNIGGVFNGSFDNVDANNFKLPKVTNQFGSGIVFENSSSIDNLYETEYRKVIDVVYSTNNDIKELIDSMPYTLFESLRNKTGSLFNGYNKIEDATIEVESSDIDLDNTVMTFDSGGGQIIIHQVGNDYRITVTSGATIDVNGTLDCSGGTLILPTS